jgi:titin
MRFRIRLLNAIAVCATSALGFSLSGCGGSAPGRPTVMSPAQLSGSGPAAGASSPLLTTWSCLTAASAGIFSSGLACDTASGMLRAQGTAALAAPGPSGNLAGAVSGSTITLTWVAPTSGDPATSYLVEAGSSPGAANLASFDTGNAATALTATDVPPGTYYVRVRARNSSGTSAPSNEVVLTVVGGGTAPCGVAPGAPTGLTASALGSLVTLTWNAPGGACAPTSYVLEAGSSSGASNLASTSTGSTATTLSANGIGAGTYYVRIRSENRNGRSAPSNEAVLTVGAGVPSPSPVTGRWVGLAPDGMLAEPGPRRCPSEFDIQLDLTSSGTVLTGTAITRLRRVGFSSCGDVLGQVATWTVANGRIDGGAVSFSLGQNAAMRFSGTLTGTRMTGTFVIDFDTQPGTFAVTKQ